MTEHNRPMAVNGSVPSWAVLLRWLVVVMVAGGVGAGASRVASIGTDGKHAAAVDADLAYLKSQCVAIQRELDQRRPWVERVPSIEARVTAVDVHLASMDAKLDSIAGTLNKLVGVHDQERRARQ